MKKLIALLSLLLFMVCSGGTYCAGYEFEYAKDLPISTGVVDVNSTYDFLTQNMDLEDSLLVKYGGTFTLATLGVYTGHEITGHGSVLRQLKIERHYGIYHDRPGVAYVPPNNYLEENAINIGGMQFETELRQRCLYQIMQKGSVSTADVLLLPRLQTEYLTSTMHGSDMQDFVDVLETEHSHSRVNSSNIRRSLLVWLDPAFIYNTYFYLRNPDPYSFDRNYPNIMPSLDFRLYPNGFTNELSLLVRRNDCFIKIGYENGTTWKESIQGVSVEFKDLHLTDKLLLDTGSKFVETCTACNSIKVKYGRVYVSAKSYFHRYFTTDVDTLVIGFDF